MPSLVGSSTGPQSSFNTYNNAINLFTVGIDGTSAEMCNVFLASDFTIYILLYLLYNTLRWRDVFTQPSVEENFVKIC